MKKILDQEVRWGVLGVGNVCEVKSAPAMNRIPRSKLVAVMRRDGSKARDYAERHGVPAWYSHAEDLVSDPRVNAVYIATPPHMHLPLTKLAASAGKPVYVEKPMARTHAECLQMISVCKEAGVPLYVAYYRRALPHFIKLKQVLDAGTIGAVRTVHINLKQSIQPDLVTHLEDNWRVNPAIAGGGYFYDLASHQLDLLDFFFGPIIHARGVAANQAGAYEAEDIVAGSFVFENGVVGTGNWCFTAAKISETDEIILYGSKGMIRFQTFGTGAFHVHVEDQEPWTFEKELPKHIQQPLIERIVGDLLGTDTSPSDGISGARTNWVLEALSLTTR